MMAASRSRFSGVISMAIDNFEVALITDAKVQELKKLLEDGSGIRMQVDSWEDTNNTMGDMDYGVVELTGSPTTIWGDNRIVYQNIQGNVVIYVSDGEVDKAKRMQETMDNIGLSYTLTGTEFLPDQGKRRWTWRFDMAGGM